MAVETTDMEGQQYTIVNIKILTATITLHSRLMCVAGIISVLCRNAVFNK
jgi:hypothetical protein